VGDGNDVGMCRAPPALLGTVVGETCGVKPAKYPGWYGGAGRSGVGGWTREWRARECERSESDRGVNAPKTGDEAAVPWTSTLIRFRGFGDCLVKDDDELATPTRLPDACGLV
jgi:hypothetical protein